MNTIYHKFVRSIITGIVLILMLGIMFSGIQRNTKAVPGWDSASVNKYAILFTMLEEVRTDFIAKNTEYKLPVLVLIYERNKYEYRESPPKIYKYPPKIYIVVWEDGKIVWGTGKGHSPIVSYVENDELEIQYFQSKIDSNRVKKVLDNFTKSAIWNSAISHPYDGSHANLIIRSGERSYSMSANRIAAFYDALPYGIETAFGAWKWERITKRVFNMIPKESCPVNISFKEYSYDSPYTGTTWLGIVEQPAVNVVESLRCEPNQQ